jgi:hypothetical protein
MVSDGVGGYHGRAELGLLHGGTRVRVHCVAWLVRRGDGAWGGWVVLPDGPRPLRQQQRGGTPVLVPGEASRWLQPRGDTAGGGEDGLCRRGSTYGDSSVRWDRPQMSSCCSTGGQTGGLVDCTKYGLELGERVLWVHPREANLSRGSPGVCQWPREVW